MRADFTRSTSFAWLRQRRLFLSRVLRSNSSLLAFRFWPGSCCLRPSSSWQLLLNDRELLGHEFANKSWNNRINWTIIAVFFVLSLILAAQVIAPELFPQG